MQKIDIYLTRTSQLVQIGLFVTTLFTIYFTVIPLYKSAQLEESLARKEAEYESLKLRTKDVLDKVNDWEYKQFVLVASQCSGLPEMLLKDESPEIGNLPPVDVDTCLHTTLSRYRFTDLSSEKYKFIQDRVVSIRPVLESVYQEYLNKYDDYPSVVDKKLREGVVLKSSIDNVDQMLNELGLKVSDHQKRDSYISSGRLEIQYGYFSALSNAIKKALGEKL